MFDDSNDIYKCSKCMYKTSRLCDYNRHIASYKHNINNNNNYDCDKKYECVCGCKYKYLSGLSRHKKKCNKYDSGITNETLMQMLIMQSQQNQYFFEQMNTKCVQLQTQSQTQNHHVNHHINIQNTQNNSFCLNIFLNETCKNALNLDEFVDSIEVTIEDVERMAELDYTSGITKLIVDKLNEITVINRPMHCTDCKREILYIKIDENWKKANIELKTKIIDAVKKITHKNMKAITLWTEKNPEWCNPTSQINDKYMKILLNSMSGATEEEQLVNVNKIVKNIIHEVIIDKNN